MTNLTEDDFNEIELAASKAMREWERGYVCQDINVRHHISWWIMQETARRANAEIAKMRFALKKIALNDSDNLPMYTPQSMQHIANGALGNHVWHTRIFSSMKVKCCVNCGFIKNEDKPNKPCPGPIGVEARA